MRNVMSEYVDINAKICTGCGACFNACPKHCISMEEDTQGFLIPKVNTDQCLRCGICRQKCPVLMTRFGERIGRLEPRAYAAQSLDAKTRYNSTSGGLFTELARWIIGQGGYVAGAIYDKQHVIRHYIGNSECDIDLLRQSKYSQSNKGNIYTQIKSLLAERKTVLFVGAPCEIGGLLTYLGGKPASLFLADFICLGANSPLVYRKYLESLQFKYGADIDKVWFKYKKNGWEKFATRVDFKNGKVYVKDRYSDLYMRGYIHKSLYLRPCCYNCQFKGFPRSADLTLGDFWGVEKSFPDLDRTFGVSAVFSNTDQGDALLFAVRNRLLLRECDIESIAHQNKQLNHSAIGESSQNAFFKDLSRIGFEKAVLLHTKEKISVIIKRKMKRFVRILKL